MITQRKKMNVVTNNITNVETVGFKSDKFVSRSFEDMMLDRLNDPSVINATTYAGPQNTGIHVDQLYTKWTEGNFQHTGQTTDMAIAGDGFFSVQTPEGVRYTRSGNFNVDVQGNLVTQEGYYVLDVNGRPINTGGENFSVNEGGVVNVGGQNIAQISVSQFTNMEGLRKMGDNTYVHYYGEVPTQMAAPVVKQGYMEGSNVDIGGEVAEMMLTNRVYESNQRMVRMVDGSLELTVKEIARF